MEFWGVEVKAGETITVLPGDDKILHLSQATLGESKKKGTDPINLFLTIDSQKLVLGTMSVEKFPNLSFDLVFEKEFLLSHNWKKGSIYFAGYKNLVDEEDDMDGFPGFSDEEQMLKAMEKEEPEALKIKPAGEKNAAAKAKVEVESSEESSDEDSDDSDEEMDDAEDGSDSDEVDDDSEEEETPTPKKAVGNKKRPAESATKTPELSKKAKVATLQKKDEKKGGHTATPHPAKQVSKTPNADKSKSPKSGGEVTCKSCSKSFKSENAMEAHSKAKHSAK